MAAPCETTNTTIEVTPEMIEAGRIAYANFNEMFDDLDDGVRRIYVAMVRAAGHTRGVSGDLASFTNNVSAAR